MTAPHSRPPFNGQLSEWAAEVRRLSLRFCASPVIQGHAGIAYRHAMRIIAIETLANMDAQS